MRSMLPFTCDGSCLMATFDQGDAKTGLLIVSGGNEIRSGAHAGQAAMAAHFAKLGYPVFRYDRRGIGESEGENGDFENSAEDIAAAVTAFRDAAPHMSRIIAFGNCDAASALMLFHETAGIDALVLANPWVIETASTTSQTPTDSPTVPTAAAIRTRYLSRLKNPRSLIDLFTGKIDLKKLFGGLARAARKDETSGLGVRVAAALSQCEVPVSLLIAERDTTALAFMGLWNSSDGAAMRGNSAISMHKIDSASHSFADREGKAWLYARIEAALG
jgi:exosortase A-associated hydrolase 1